VQRGRLLAGTAVDDANEPALDEATLARPGGTHVPQSLFLQNVIAVVWDFDKTLTPGYMQAPLFGRFGIVESDFWKEVNALPGYYQKRGLQLVSKDTLGLRGTPFVDASPPSWSSSPRCARPSSASGLPTSTAARSSLNKHLATVKSTFLARACPTRQPPASARSALWTGGTPGPKRRSDAARKWH